MPDEPRVRARRRRKTRGYWILAVLSPVTLRRTFDDLRYSVSWPMSSTMSMMSKRGCEEM